MSINVPMKQEKPLYLIIFVKETFNMHSEARDLALRD